VSHYGLHYQLFPEHIVLTFMPGKKWLPRNADFVTEIEAAVREVLAVAARSPARTPVNPA
jgi:hypothetical protein